MSLLWRLLIFLHLREPVKIEAWTTTPMLRMQIPPGVTEILVYMRPSLAAGSYVLTVEWVEL